VRQDQDRTDRAGEPTAGPGRELARKRKSDPRQDSIHGSSTGAESKLGQGLDAGNQKHARKSRSGDSFCGQQFLLWQNKTRDVKNQTVAAKISVAKHEQGTRRPDRRNPRLKHESRVANRKPRRKYTALIFLAPAEKYETLARTSRKRDRI
jgi:hypothetical protein